METVAWAPLFKVVLIGDSGVGKSNLVARYVLDEFHAETVATIGVEFLTKVVKVEDKMVKVQIWDTAGQERFRAIARTMYQGAKGAMLVYDITVKESFDNVLPWYEELRTYIPPKTVIMLVGNKSDLAHVRAVPTAMAQQFAEKRGLLFLETSAMDTTNVQKAFEVLVAEIVHAQKAPQVTRTDKKALQGDGQEVVIHLNAEPAPPRAKGRCGCKA